MRFFFRLKDTLWWLCSSTCSFARLLAYINYTPPTPIRRSLANIPAGFEIGLYQFLLLLNQRSYEFSILSHQTSFSVEDVRDDVCWEDICSFFSTDRGQKVAFRRDQTSPRQGCESYFCFILYSRVYVNVCVWTFICIIRLCWWTYRSFTKMCQ